MARKLILLFVLSSFISCGNKKPETTPWGTTISEEVDTTSTYMGFTLDDIIANGEMIMLTISGPDTYYDYHGRGMGLQYFLCEKFAQRVGVSLRVELCRDTTELVRRLVDGEGDVIAYPLPTSIQGDIIFCGAGNDSTRWSVAAGNRQLADSLDGWFRPELIAKARQEETLLLSTSSVTRHVYSPMLNRNKGIISKYDHYFQRYAPVAHMDWRLMAAQCYQESCFDPKARSWAGALGLMQIMPSTASQLGLSMDRIHEPEANIEAAARYMAQLQANFNDIQDPSQRILFALACYNGGYFHIRDAMALASKYGRNPKRWEHVSEFVLKLSSPQYYRDPVVKYGYMRGSETADYVERIRNRWAQYRGVAASAVSNESSRHYGSPVKAKRENKYKVDG